MNIFKISVPRTAYYLQRLNSLPEVREAVTRGDIEAFTEICEEAEIPENYVHRLLRLVFSVEPEQWPGWS